MIDIVIFIAFAGHDDSPGSSYSMLPVAHAYIGEKIVLHF